MTTENGSPEGGNPNENTPPAEGQTFDFSTAVSSVENEELRGWIENKGFDGVDKMAQSYRNLEQVFGADKAGRTVVKPGDNATPEEMAEFYSNLGRPETPADYGFQPPEGQDGKFTDFAKNMFHEAGLSDAQASKVVEQWNEYMATQAEESQASYAQTVEADENALKKEWGAAYDKNINIARQAAKEFGVDESQVDALEDALGFSGLMKFMQKVGSRLGEDGFENSETGGGNDRFGGLSPAQAKARISELKADNGFRQRLMNRDTDAQTQWDNLHKMAYGAH